MYKLCLIFLLTAIASRLEAQTFSQDTTELCFASDTQAPMWIETLFLKKNNNKQATKKLFEAISERRPGALFIMGDVVNLGYSNRQWRPMDAYLKDLRSKNISVHAALGNHEVMGQAKKGMRKFQERFPDHAPTGYMQVKDSVAVVLLNSNFGKLSAEENAAQLKWYKETLQKLDNDPSIHFVISGCHHSPYTNSKVVGASKDVQEKFVPLFLASQKSKLFITGHSHNYEHFQKGGKDFFVIGGGGRNNDLLPASENSIELIPLASQLGANGIEIDVKYTKDSVPVLYHDDRINDRLTNKTTIEGPIEDYSFAELQNEVKLKRGGKIPTLRQALEAVLYKTPLEFVWLDCKFKGSLEKVIALQNEFTTRAEGMGRRLEIFIGIPDEDVFNNFTKIPNHKTISSLCELDTLKFMQANASIWAPSWTKGHQDAEVGAIHAKGKKAVVWTVDIPDKIKECMYEADFDGLCTNRPTMAAYYYYARRKQ